MSTVEDRVFKARSPLPPPTTGDARGIRGCLCPINTWTTSATMKHWLGQVRSDCPVHRSLFRYWSKFART